MNKDISSDQVKEIQKLLNFRLNLNKDLDDGTKATAWHAGYTAAMKDVTHIIENCVSERKVNLSRWKIEKLIEVAEMGENVYTETFKPARKRLELPSRLLAGKVLIDRWGEITTSIIFNLEHKRLVKKCLEGFASNKENPNTYYDGQHIWGADILFSEYMPSNKILILSQEDRVEEFLSLAANKEEQDNDFNCGRAIALVPMVEDLYRMEE